MVISGNTSSMITVVFMKVGPTSIWLMFMACVGFMPACMLCCSKKNSAA